MREAEMALIDVTINALVLVVICLPPPPPPPFPIVHPITIIKRIELRL